MMIDAMTFDLGGSPSVSLSLVSSEGLEPLPMPMSLEGQVEKFNQFINGDAQERRPDVSLGFKALAQVLVERRETLDAPQASRPASDEVIAEPRFYDVVRPPRPCNKGEGALATSGFAITSDASRPAPASRPLPAADAPCVVEMLVTAETPRVVEEPVVVEKPVSHVVEATVERRETIDASQVSRLVPQDSRPASQVSRPAIASRPLPAADAPRVAETPVAAETPRVVEAPMAVEIPRVAEATVARRETIDAPQASRPASDEVIAEPRFYDVARAPSPLQQGRGGLATSGFAITADASRPAIVSRPLPAADVPRVAEVSSIPKEGVDMKIEATTYVLGGNPPVKVQLVSSDGLAPLPLPSAEARFRTAMEDESPSVAKEVPLVHNPMVVPPTIDADAATASAADAVSAASSRTESIVQTVNEIVETVVDKISVTPTLAQGEGEIRITLRPTVLDGSSVRISAKGGELTVVILPATPEAALSASSALPRLEAALAAHAGAFHYVAVVLSTAKKGKLNETA